MVLPSFTRTQLSAGAPGPETALTIGVLDGIHLGHEALLKRLVDEAQSRALWPGVVTLHPHPLTVLRPETQPSYLTSLEERMRLILNTGCEWIIPITFTPEVAEVECEDLGRAFYEDLNMRLLLLGPDGAFGKGAPGDTVERMQRLGSELGFDVIQMEPVMMDGDRYSSTAVREALAAGNMERVTRLLGRPYQLAGPVVAGAGRGRTISFPTANIAVAATRALPALGVYATRVHVGGRTYMGATNIGRRPTFEDSHISIETNILDFNQDIYGQKLAIDIVHRIRPEQTFSSVDALTAQIAEDVETARSILA